MQPRVFIAHADTEADFARRVAAALAERRVEPVLGLDAALGKSASKTTHAVRDAIIGCDALVPLISPAGIVSPELRDAVSAALQWQVRMVPVVAEDLDAGTRANLAGDTVGAALERLHWIRARPHDAFDQAMDQLAASLRRELVRARAHGALLQRALAWDGARRPARLLMRGRELAEAQAWVERSPAPEPSPTALEGAYLQASIERGRRGRGRLWPHLLWALLVVGLVGAAVAWQGTQANLLQTQSQARELAASIPLALERGRPVQALELGAQAQALHPSANTRAALLEGFDALRGLQRLPTGVFHPFGPLAWSADGTLVAATRCEDGSAQSCAQPRLVVIEAASGRTLVSHASAQPVDAVGFSPDGKQIVLATCCNERPVNGLDGKPMPASSHAALSLYDLPAAAGSAGASGDAKPPGLGDAKRRIDIPGGPLAMLAFDGEQRLMARNEFLLRWSWPEAKLEMATPHAANFADARLTRLLEVRSTEGEPPRDRLVLQRVVDGKVPPRPPRAAPAIPADADPALVAALTAEAEAAAQAASAAAAAATASAPSPSASGAAGGASSSAPIDLGSSAFGQAAFSPSASRVAAVTCRSGGTGEHCMGELRLFDVEAGRPVGELQADLRSLNAMLAVSFLDDRWLVTGGCGRSTPTQACVQGQLRLWSVREDGLRPAGPDIRVPGGEVIKLAASPQGESLATVGADGRLVLWSTAPATLNRTGLLPSPLQASRIDLPDAPVTRCQDANVYHPLLQPANLGLSDPASACRAIEGLDPGWPQAAAWDVQQRRVAVGGCKQLSDNGACIAGVVQRFEVRDGKLEPKGVQNLGAGVTALAWQRGGPALAVATCLRSEAQGCALGATVEVMGAEGEAPRMLVPSLGHVGALAFSGNGRALAYATCSEPPGADAAPGTCLGSNLRAVELTHGAPLGASVAGPRSAVHAIAFGPSPGGVDTGLPPTLAVGDVDGELSLWAMHEGLRLGPALRVASEPIEALNLESDGQLLAITPSGRSRWLVGDSAWQQAACRLAGGAAPAASQAAAPTAAPTACNADGSVVPPAARPAWFERWQGLVAGSQARWQALAAPVISALR